MAGINLSQSMTGNDGSSKKKEALFDTGFVVAFLIFLVVVLGWAGLRFYITQLNKQITALDTTIAEHNAELQGGAVDRVADFDRRLQFLAENATERTEPSQIFSQLESLMVPSNALLEYEYNKTEKVITFSARTNNYRNIAEQVISLKSEKMFSSVKVDTIDRDKEGRITFTLKAHF